MYSKCGGLGHALDVFGRMVERSVVSWTAMISTFAGEGRKGDERGSLQGADVAIAYLVGSKDEN
ncbi:hypothetical protein EJ110_NYTH58200 [Nymphaea thermarum]|nr:hypothetical protein EJ110_NYTH58200 [Nymphaea thermarum]